MNLDNIKLQLEGDRLYKAGDIQAACLAWDKAAKHAEQIGKPELAQLLRERIKAMGGK